MNITVFLYLSKIQWFGVFDLVIPLTICISNYVTLVHMTMLSEYVNNPDTITSQKYVNSADTIISQNEVYSWNKKINGSPCRHQIYFVHSQGTICFKPSNSAGSSQNDYCFGYHMANCLRWNQAWLAFNQSDTFQAPWPESVYVDAICDITMTIQAIAYMSALQNLTWHCGLSIAVS